MKIIIAWLYPKLMSIYGDYGNVLTLIRRLEWRGIKVTVLEIDFKNTKDLKKADLILMGGGQDRQQTICAQDLLEHKKPYLKEAYQKGIPGLFACGGYQLMGHFYHPLDTSEINHFDPLKFKEKLASYKFVPGKGADLPGLEIFNQYTTHYGQLKPRCIGNIATEIDPQLQSDINAIYHSKSFPKTNHLTTQPFSHFTTLVGFENHGGRTYFMKSKKHENMKTKNNNLAMGQFPAIGWSASGGNHIIPLGKVLKGWGNNGEDGQEGIVSHNFIGTYLHGFLIKNPHIADWLISKALRNKYQKDTLEPLNDQWEWQTHERFKKQILE